MHRTEIIGGVSMRDTFGARLKKIRKSKKITQEQLAKKAGISAVSINFYETGRLLPNVSTLEWICGALEISSAELLDF